MPRSTLRAVLGGRKSEKDLLENFSLDCTFWETIGKKPIKTFTVERGSAINFPLWKTDVAELLLLSLFIDNGFQRAGKIRHTLVSCAYCAPEVVSRIMKYLYLHIYIHTYIYIYIYIYINLYIYLL